MIIHNFRSAMDNTLIILINYYEQEKTRLLKLIDDCLKELEYLMAHSYFTFALMIDAAFLNYPFLQNMLAE